jgi:hypothetical protein
MFYGDKILFLEAIYSFLSAEYIMLTFKGKLALRIFPSELSIKYYSSYIISLIELL